MLGTFRRKNNSMLIILSYVDAVIIGKVFTIDLISKVQ